MIAIVDTGDNKIKVYLVSFFMTAAAGAQAADEQSCVSTNYVHGMQCT